MGADGNWDHEVDVLVVGTGAAGLTAALAAGDAGANVLVVEALPTWGGTTSWSGGAVWAPNNSYARKAGLSDSPEDALTYMESVIGDVGPASSRERKLAFIDTIPKAMDFLNERGAAWEHMPYQSDYHPEMPGGRRGGRTVQCAPFDLKKLGKWRKTWHGAANDYVLPLKASDLRLVSRGMRTWDGFSQAARIVFRTLGGIVRGKALRAGGNALSARLLIAILAEGIPVWLSSPMKDLIIEDGVVAGARVEHEGKMLRVRARGGVVLAAGVFAHRSEWREAYQHLPGWSASSPGDLGTAIEAGQHAGAATSMFDQAWWNPVYMDAKGKPQTILIERSMPHGMMVNQSGVRFVNESASYSNVGHAMVRNSTSLDDPILGTRSPAVPSWLIGDRRLSSRYMYQPAMGGKKGKAALTAKGEYFEAPSLEELADLINVPRGALLATVERFNGFARSGKDVDFGRGESAYDWMYCDPRCKPNPNLGEIVQGPFTALRIYPGDIGTKGGLLTDEHGRVVGDDGKPLAGLYAAGNTTASVMGDTYPGGGSTLGPAIAFGYLAGRHATARYQDRLNSQPATTKKGDI